VPLSFGVIRLERFPTDGTHTVQQLAIAGFDHTITTTIERAEDWHHARFQKFHVRHESVLRLEGRYRNEDISEVIEVHRFDIYASHDGSWAAVRAPKRLWLEALHRVEKDAAKALVFARESVDLSALLAKISSSVSGGWFGELDIEKVHTAGIFGADVAESDEWGHYEGAGTLQAIVVELPFGDKPISMMLGHDWTVVLYRDLGELENLAFVEELREMVRKALGA